MGRGSNWWVVSTVSLFVTFMEESAERLGASKDHHRAGIHVFLVTTVGVLLAGFESNHLIAYGLKRAHEARPPLVPMDGSG